MRRPASFALLWCAACAAREPTVSGPEDRAAQHEEIQRLEARISQAEQRLGMAPAAEATMEAPPPGADAEAREEEQAPTQPAPLGQAGPAPTTRSRTEPPEARFASPPPGDGAAHGCADVCRSAEAICEAAERICRIADELDDAWARGRCDAASRSCRAAEERASDRCGCE